LHGLDEEDCLGGVGKYIRIDKNVGTSDRPKWKTVLGCERVEVWETSTATEVDSSSVLRVFHIAHHPAVVRGARITYLGRHLDILRVSDSSKLVGIEVLCELD
jgi:hypothetical protein